MRGVAIDADAARRTVARHGLDWLYSEDTGSTNADVLTWFDREAREAVAFSESQREGRGRRGRQWHSPFASNIYCTVGLARSMPASALGLLSIVTGIALCRALRSAAGSDIRLKWPNDLLFDGRKLGGILIESRTLADDRYFFAIGFGLNVYMNAREVAALGRPATCLQRVAERAIDRGALLGAAIDAVVTAVRGFDPAEVARLVTEFDEFDAYRGLEVEVIDGGSRIRGRNLGITLDGQLRLETGSGLQLYSAAEISLTAVG